MDAGAFSDDRVVAESKRYVRVMVNCTEDDAEKKKFRARHDFKGFPTILYLSPDGDLLEKMVGLRDAPTVTAQMRRLAAPWLPENLLRDLLSPSGDPWDWIRDRVERLGDDDIEIRTRAAEELQKLQDALAIALELAAKSSDPEVRARILQIRGSEKTGALVVKIQSHTVVQEGSMTVDFGCVSEQSIFLTIKGIVVRRLIVVNREGKIAEFSPASELPLPKGFGIPVELRVFPDAP